MPEAVVRANNGQRRRILKWFVRDLLVTYRRTWLLIAFMSGCLALMQGVPIITVNWALRAIEASSAIATPFGELHPSSEQLVLWAVVASIVALALSAVVEYAQSLHMLGLWRRYQLRTVDAVSQGLASYAARVQPLPFDLKRFSARSVGRSQRIAALTRVLYSGITPLLRLVVFIGTAFSINAQATFLFLLLLLPVSLVVGLVFARRASRKSREAEEGTPAAAAEIFRRLDSAASGRVLALTGEKTKNGFTIRVDAFLARLRAVSTSKMVAVVLASLVLLLLTASDLFGQDGGGVRGLSLLIYLATVILCLVQLAQLVNLVSKLGRFYPAVVEQYMVLHALEGLLPEKSANKWLARNRGGDELLEEDA